MTSGIGSGPGPGTSATFGGEKLNHERGKPLPVSLSETVPNSENLLPMGKRALPLLSAEIADQSAETVVVREHGTHSDSLSSIRWPNG